MKKNIVIIIYLIAPFLVQSQDLTLVVDKMRVSNYDYIQTGLDEMEVGPTVRLYCSLKNNTSDSIELVEKKCVIEYLYNDTVYTINYYMQLNLTEVIDPNSEIKFYYYYTLLLGTPYFPDYVESGNRMDYREMLMQILPTIKMKFNYKGKEIISKEIKKVELGNKDS
ncbi:MAG: hypothetical protein WC984_05405 [Bacteroidales bacterium]